MNPDKTKIEFFPISRTLVTEKDRKIQYQSTSTFFEMNTMENILSF
jgi:hypothetical protein